MAVSIFDIFKIGVGPSSSHTMGPMTAAADFMARVPPQVARLQVVLYGSLALTGRGHATDVAIMAGLAGLRPENIDPDAMEATVAQIRAGAGIVRTMLPPIAFDPETDIVWQMRERLDGHANGMRFLAWDPAGKPIAERRSFSIGGGSVIHADEPDTDAASPRMAVPHAFGSAQDLLALCARSGCSIADVQRHNELAIMPETTFVEKVGSLTDAMSQCIERGLRCEGVLPGGLQVRRRAPDLYAKLQERAKTFADPLAAYDWLKVWAIAANEENASGGRVVTAPTNGAAGIIPAVIHYYLGFVHDANLRGLQDFLLTAGAVGLLFKRNASISGAEVGCQGEVGVACSMAAAGLAAVLGGSPAQVENAAEIGMEHNLGLTCDPIAGLVQIPCIERNGMGAVQAVEAARLALLGDGKHRVSLDQAIGTMSRTGADMSDKYKETSLGGLAVSVVAC